MCDGSDDLDAEPDGGGEQIEPVAIVTPSERAAREDGLVGEFGDPYFLRHFHARLLAPDLE